MQGIKLLWLMITIPNYGSLHPGWSVLNSKGLAGLGLSETVMEDNNPVLFILVRQQWIYYVSIPPILVRQ